MKKFIVLLVLLFSVNLSSGTMAVTRYKTEKTGANFVLTDAMKTKIQKHCPKIMNNAQKRIKKTEVYCPVSEVVLGARDFGPWRKMLYVFEKLFYQIRNLLYLAAVFMIIWIYVKGAYEGEMHWMQISFLVIGVVIMAGAEVLFSLAKKEVTLDDVMAEGIYVDCRENSSSMKPYYKCNTESRGARLEDTRYFYMVVGEKRNTSYNKGLY